MAASQLFADLQTDHGIIAIPILTHRNVRFFSSSRLPSPALKVVDSIEGSAGGGGGGKVPTKNGSGKNVEGAGSGKQSGDNGGGDDKLVNLLLSMLRNI